MSTIEVGGQMETLGAMAYSDAIIFEKLRELIASGEKVTQRGISEASGLPLCTTQRALRRLMKSGHISGVFKPRIGYTYTIVSDNTRRTANTTTA